MSSSPATDALLVRFQFDRLLRQDEAGRRLCLIGKIDSTPAILIAERAAFSTSSGLLDSLASSLTSTYSLGDNDVYRWYLANTPRRHDHEASDLKLTLIHPCDAKHVAKYSAQQYRVVTETAQVYQTLVRPWIAAQMQSGRLNWVYNILDGKTEQEQVIHRCQSLRVDDDDDGDEADPTGYILLPNLNWDRKTVASLDLLAIVERRDLASMRDLKKRHVPWLKAMIDDIASVVDKLYGPVVEADMLKYFIHYHPTYYHLHIHVMHVALEANGTQAVGKAISLHSIISQLETMAGGPDASMADTEQILTLGEASELWHKIFGPLKAGKAPKVGT